MKAPVPGSCLRGIVGTSWHHLEIQSYGNFPSIFMVLVEPGGIWEHHGGKLRFVGSSGSNMADPMDAQNQK